MQEIWKDIEDFEGMYQISNLGRVRSLGMSFTRTDFKPYTRKPQFMKPIKNRVGYLSVELHNKGYSKRYLIHRLVAQAFIPNKDNLPEINHIDENKTNNCVDNLEWCTHKYNSTYGTRATRIKDTIKKTKKAVPVLMYSKDGVLLSRFEAINEAALTMNISCGSIVECCKGKRRKSAGGYVWKYDL